MSTVSWYIVAYLIFSYAVTFIALRMDCRRDNPLVIGSIFLTFGWAGGVVALIMVPSMVLGRLITGRWR
jgi:hypothetical protein